MTLYVYHCETCGDVELRHPMSEVDLAHTCPTCGSLLRRRLLPLHHWWPSQYRPGNEQSGQRLLLDPDYQARKRDQVARQADESRSRREAQQKAQGAAHE